MKHTDKATCSVHLVKKAQKGSKDAFVKLIKQNERSLYRISKSFLKSDVDCADAIQETILKAYQAVKGLNEASYFYTWLVRILINECKRILDQRKKVIPVFEFKAITETKSNEQQLDLQDMLESLEEDLRIIVTLFYQEDLPVKEIALLLNIPEGTVKSRLSRARAKLAMAIHEDNERSTSHEQK